MQLFSACRPLLSCTDSSYIGCKKAGDLFQISCFAAPTKNAGYEIVKRCSNAQTESFFFHKSLFAFREVICLPNPDKQLIVQFFYGSNNNMRRPSAGVWLCFYSNTVRLQRIRQSKCNNDIRIWQIRFFSDTLKRNAGIHMTVRKSNLRFLYSDCGEREYFEQFCFKSLIQRNCGWMIVKKHQGILSCKIHLYHPFVLRHFYLSKLPISYFLNIFSIGFPFANSSIILSR